MHDAAPDAPPPPQSAVPTRTPAWSWAVLAVVVVAAAAIRWHRLSVPFERDEGEYAYAGKLLLQGHPPYEAAYNMKLPGIYAVYAAAMLLFGVTAEGVRIGLIVANALSTLLVHRIARRAADDVAAVAAAAAFASVSLHPAFTGLFANAEHFVLPPALAGLLVALTAARSGRVRDLFAAGALTGLAFTVKQHGAGFVVAGGAIVVAAAAARPVVWRELLARGAWFAAGAALPFALVCAWMAAAGVFGRFWFWTFTYAREYASQVGLADGVEVLRAQLAQFGGGLLPFWILAGAGAAAACAAAALRPARAFLLLFAAGSVAAVCPGLLFRGHYFLLLLPAAAVLAGAAVSELRRVLAARARPALAGAVAATAALAAAAAPVAAEWDLLARMPDGQVSRATYGVNPFPESVVVAEYLRARTRPDETVAVIGSEPQIYFYSGRRAATGHIYTYALMEEQPFALELQREMIREIEASRPATVVFVGVATSWLRRQGSPTEILEWAGRYVDSGFRQVGLIEIGADGTRMRWDADARRAEPATDAWIRVYRREGP